MKFIKKLVKEIKKQIWKIITTVQNHKLTLGSIRGPWPRPPSSQLDLFYRLIYFDFWI